MLSKTSLQSLTHDELEKFNQAESALYCCFHELRQAHIKFASLLSNPKYNFVLSESIIEENAALFARLFDLDRDYVRFVKHVQSENHISK